MATLIIRSLDDGLAARLKAEAQKRGLSLNNYLQQLLAHAMSGAPAGAAGAAGDPVRRNDLRKLAGRWSARQAREFALAVEQFAVIDPDIWQ